MKAARPWSRVWHPRHLPAVDAARVVLGHTRHATQGAADRLANAAPLVVGAGLVGAVNGDIDADGLHRRLPPGLPAPHGETDSEVLLSALERAGPDLGAVCRVLAAMRGPSALAWVHPARPERLYVARRALCPLALATDAAGNLYWASSPTWLRRVAGLEAERVPEGTLLVVAAGVRPAVVAERRFVPVARPGDDQCFPSIWEGLDSEDVAAFQAEARHLVAPGPPAVEAAA